jgi:hypothetical protein
MVDIINDDALWRCTAAAFGMRDTGLAFWFSPASLLEPVQAVHLLSKKKGPTARAI